MSKKEKNEKKENNNSTIDLGLGKLGLGGLIDGINNLVDLAGKLEEAGGGIRKEGEIHFGDLGKNENPLKGVFGFSVNTAAGGTPKVEPFGNIKKTAKGPVVKEEREPITDIFDEKNEIIIMVEMPGVTENNIKIEVTGDILELSAKDGKRNYRKEILLPLKVKPENLSSHYNNGILEIKIKK